MRQSMSAKNQYLVIEYGELEASCVEVANEYGGTRTVCHMDQLFTRATQAGEVWDGRERWEVRVRVKVLGLDDAYMVAMLFIVGAEWHILSPGV
jgi:hypothetical protein